MAGLDVGSCPGDLLGELLRQIRAGRRRLSGFEARLTREVKRREEARRGPTADDQLRGDGDTSHSDAKQRRERADLGDEFPAVGDDLDEGATSEENLDHLARQVKDLSPSELARLKTFDAEIAEQARLQSPEGFRRYLIGLLRSIADEPSNRPSRAEQQKASSSFAVGRRRDGMWWVKGELDDERGAEIARIIRQMARALADDMPASDGRVTDNLRAAALHHLLTHATETAAACTCDDGAASTSRPASDRNAASSGAGAGGAGRAPFTRPDGPGPASETAHPTGLSGSDGGPGPGSGPYSGPGPGPGAGSGPGPGAGSGPGPGAGRSADPGAGLDGGPGPGTGPRDARIGGHHGTCRCGGGRGVEPPLRLGIGYIVDVHTLAHGPHAATVAQTWAGHDIDPRAAGRHACDADCYAILIDELGRPGPVGRTRRSATRNQRLQLRALYAACPLDGTPFEWCQIHHVNQPWEAGGPTETDNLLPISPDWHHRIHDRGWTLTMHPDRALTLTRPDGTIDRTVDPPLPLTCRCR
ncbi:MAG: hypothetical protein ACFCVK_01645 [Acidimicrobiales bacterium]